MLRRYRNGELKFTVGAALADKSDGYDSGVLMKYDIAIVGAGLVSLGAAYQLSAQFPQLRILILEKEAYAGMHQSGHNSGVLHSGIYYPPGSIKSRTCLEGKALLSDFCREQQIALRRLGKVIVATEERELPTVNRLMENARSAGIAAERVTSERLREIEPLANGLEAIHLPDVSVINFSGVVRRFVEILGARGHTLIFGAKVNGFISKPDSVIVQSTAGDYQVKVVINCAGLYADVIARLAGSSSNTRIVPFRGEYYELKESVASRVRGLIYPVPDSRFPFLGVHLTRMFNDVVECGPNAVLALAREGYRWSNINLGELFGTLASPGFIKFAAEQWRTGFYEVARSLSRAMFLRSINTLAPEIVDSDLKPGARGVRAQAISPEGKLLSDFHFDCHDRFIHVLNAPSPAATACLSIGNVIVETYASRFMG